MNKIFLKKNPESIGGNVFDMIGTKWMLIASGNIDSYNMMCASWGGMGVLWGKKVCFCFIRPGRYTYEFVEKSSYFTLNFFDESYRKTLEYCGINSGRNVNKMAVEELNPAFDMKETLYFNEAMLILGCKKIYYQDIDPSKFLDKNINKNYPDKDYHRMYVGEIIYCLNKVSG